MVSFGTSVNDALITRPIASGCVVCDMYEACGGEPTGPKYTEGNKSSRSEKRRGSEGVEGEALPTGRSFVRQSASSSPGSPLVPGERFACIHFTKVI